MGDIGGESVAEVLGRHIGEGVNFDHGGEGGADRKAKAVDQPLYHQDTKIHNGLLNGGQGGVVDDKAQQPPAEMKMLPLWT